MNRNGKDIQTNRGTVEEGSLPGFLGNEGKSKEVSSVFAAILARGCHKGNESQGTVQNHWLASLEQFGGGRTNAISNRSRCIPFHFRYIFKWNGIVQKVAQSNVLGTSGI